MICIRFFLFVYHTIFCHFLSFPNDMTWKIVLFQAIIIYLNRNATWHFKICVYHHLFFFLNVKQYLGSFFFFCSDKQCCNDHFIHSYGAFVCLNRQLTLSSTFQTLVELADCPPPRPHQVITPSILASSKWILLSLYTFLLIW